MNSIDEKPAEGHETWNDLLDDVYDVAGGQRTSRAQHVADLWELVHEIVAVPWFGDPGDEQFALRGIDALIDLRAEIARVEPELVRAARLAGYSWARIARVSGVSRQTAWERWEHLERERSDEIPALLLGTYRMGSGSSRTHLVEAGRRIALCGTHGLVSTTEEWTQSEIDCVNCVGDFD